MNRFPRATIAPTIALAVLLLAAAPAAAAAPERSKLTAYSVDFPAGLICDFAVNWDFAGTGNLLIFPVTAAGDQVVRQVGLSTGTITNVDTGASVTIRGGIRQDLVFHADGTIDGIMSGHVLAGYYPTDVGGPAMWLFRGHLHDEIDATFTATAHSFQGNATDLCAALS
jgi:hypothetical protein